jgi:hypothetical protein
MPNSSSRRDFVAGIANATGALTGSAPAGSQNDREYWISVLRRIASPVLTAAGKGQLHAAMPVEASPAGNVSDRRLYTHLEALGRLLCGIAPWLESGVDDGAEGALRREFAELARRSIQAATDPRSADYMNFSRGQQPVVDAAFLAHALVRAPGQLWRKLDPPTREHVVAALRASRAIKPGFNNWLLFSAMVEAALCQAGESWDAMRVDYAVRQHDAWYKGDGVYGDGPQLHWDYYNSFVIQPMLLDVLGVVSQTASASQWTPFLASAIARARRYAAIQERLISPEGTFPAIGRSIAYRFGAFQLLAQMALRRQLPDGVAAEQVRSALTAVIRRMIEAPGTFDSQGWLTIGFCGHQPNAGEGYISTGSLYLCAAALLPLGLPVSDPFWAGPAKPWSAQKIWSGVDVPADHAL